MATVAEIAEQIRAGYAASMLEGMLAPIRFFADRFESCYVPARPTDGWFDAQRLIDYQAVELDIIRSVLPDAHMTDIKVITRAEDQVILVTTLTGTLRTGAPFTAPITMVYDVVGGQIIRVIGLYEPSKLAVFAKAFAETAKTRDVPIDGSRHASNA